MTDALEDHKDTVSSGGRTIISIGGRTITNLRLADAIDGLEGEEEELTKLVQCLDKASTAYSIEISAEETKLMTNNTCGINREKVNGQKLETITNFKYLGSVKTDEGSKPDIDKVETSLERQKHFSQFQHTTDALHCHIRLPVCL